MELAFPQGRIKQASPAVIQGDISQWGNQTTSRTHGKCGALGQGFQMTSCVVGSMVLLLLLGTHADGPSEQSETYWFLTAQTAPVEPIFPVECYE